MSTTAPSDNGEPDNIAYKLIAATVVAILLPTIALSLRLFARRLLRIRLYLDDWLMIIAWIFKLGLDISGCLLIEHGMGRHIQTVSPSSLLYFLKVQYTGSIQYPLCVTFTKLSILYQYKRLFPTPHFKRLTNLIILILLLWCTGVVFTGIFLCWPVSKAWLPMQEGSCIDLEMFYYGMQIPNVVTDVMILVLPVREVVGLELPLKQKMGVAVTCGLWIISLIFGIVRLVVMVDLTHSTSQDATYILVPPAIWTTIEPAIQISTACLPSIRVLYRTARDRNYKSRVSQRLQSFSLTSGSTRPHGNGDMLDMGAFSTWTGTCEGSEGSSGGGKNVVKQGEKERERGVYV